MNIRLSKRQSQILSMIMSAALFAAMFFVSGKAAYFSNVWNEQKESESVKCVVIDAGHGGIDPGKVGINNALEKDINLAIAKKVKKYLETQDVKVVMTREDDNGLYNDTDTNKKVCDMKARLRIIDEAVPKLAISIHQNSYPQENVSGVQVFFYKDSLAGEKAALIMQEQMIQTLQPDKERQAKGNGSYYLLKKTSVPIIIVECGFLSNSHEAELLITEEYQDKVAWAIHLGILKYISSEG